MRRDNDVARHKAQSDAFGLFGAIRRLPTSATVSVPRPYASSSDGVVMDDANELDRLIAEEG